MESSESESDETNFTVLMPNNCDTENDNWFTSDQLQVGFFTVHSVIFVLGLTGNLLVIYSILREKSKGTVVNVFMSSLAVANILLCLFVVPLDPVYWLVKKWPFGPIMCHLWPCIYHSACYGSMLMLASMAVNHYLVTVRQLRQKTKMRKLMAMWLVSIAASSSFGIFYTYSEHTDRHNQYIWCYQIWPSEIGYSIYFAIVFVILFLIPMTIITYFYIALSIKISRMSTADDSKEKAEDKRTYRLLIIMAIVNCICWTPYHIVEMTMSHSDNLYWEPFVFVSRVVHAMALTSACFTPLFYVWLNKITIEQFLLCGSCCKFLSRQASNVDHIDTNGHHAYAALNDEDTASDVTYNAHCQSINLVSFNRV